MRKPTLILLALSGLILIGCSLKEPGSPSWQTDVTVPIANRAYTLAEIITDSSEVDSVGNWISTSQGLLVFNLADSLEPTYIAEELKYDPVDEVINTYVGIRTVDSPGEEITQYLITQLAPQLQLGVPLPVAPFAFNQPLRNLGSYEEYDWAYLDWGDALVTVTNNLPVPLTGLIIDVYGAEPPLLLAHILVPDSLAPGESTGITALLPQGEEIDNTMQVQIAGQSPGSNDPIIVEEVDNIQVGVLMNPLGVTQALAQLSAQSFNEDSLYNLEENNIVRLAVIREGDVSYEVENLTEFVNIVTFTLPDFTRDGHSFSEADTLLPNQSLSINNRDLSGYMLNRPQSDNMIRAIVTSDILDTQNPLYQVPNSMVEFDANDQVRTEFHVSTLKFSSFEGELDNMVVEIDQPAEILDDIPEGLESLQVAATLASLHLVNTMGMPVEFHLTLQGYKNGVVAASLDAPVLILPAAQGGNPGILNQNIAGLETIINVLPDSIKSVGHAVINGSGVLMDDQFISGYFCISTPFRFTVGETTLEPEVTVMDNGIAEELQRVDLRLNLANAVPMSGEALILASHDSSHFRVSNANDVDTLMRVPLPAAQLNNQGYVVSPGMVSVDQTLDEQAMALFRNASTQNPLYLQTTVLIHSTQGDTVNCMAADYVSVGATARLILNINTN